jgi:hypothetical protein
MGGDLAPNEIDEELVHGLLATAHVGVKPTP